MYEFSQNNILDPVMYVVRIKYDSNIYGKATEQIKGI